MRNVEFVSLAATACIAFAIFYGSVTGSETRLLGLPFDWLAFGAAAIGFVVVDQVMRYLYRNRDRGD